MHHTHGDRARHCGDRGELEQKRRAAFASIMVAIIHWVHNEAGDHENGSAKHHPGKDFPLGSTAPIHPDEPDLGVSAGECGPCSVVMAGP